MVLAKEFKNIFLKMYNLYFYFLLSIYYDKFTSLVYLISVVCVSFYGVRIY